MSLNYDDFKLILCPARHPDDKSKLIYNEIYTCWNNVWSSAYSEVNFDSSKESLRSDNFTRQDFIAAIFCKAKCIAFILFRHVDPRLQSTKDDSFFSQWNELQYQTVIDTGKKILICGNLGIHPLFRKNNLGFSLKEVIGGIICEVTLQLDADATLATPRRDRNVQNAAYQWGARPIAQDVDWGYGIRVDLISFEKNSIAKFLGHPLTPFVKELWKNKNIVDGAQNVLIDQLRSLQQTNFEGHKELKNG